MSWRRLVTPSNRLTAVWPIVFSLVLTLACACEKKKSSTPPSPTPSPVPAEVSAPPAPTAVDSEATGDQQSESGSGKRVNPPIPALTESQVAALIEAWVAAQNEGKYEDYAKLYSASFRGVRRSGKKRVELDHDAWLGERARMFKRDMNVSISKLKIQIASAAAAGGTGASAGANQGGTGSGAGATVDFEQTWESGNYADRGPKRMTVESIAGQLLITSEDMLSSTRIATSMAPLIAMYPDPEDRPENDSLHCEELDPSGDLQMCAVTTDLEAASVSVDIGLLRRQGTKFKLLDSNSAEYSVTSAMGMPFGSDGEDLGLTESADVSVSTVEIGPGKVALEVELSAESMIHEEAGTTNTGKQITLFTAVGDDIIEALSLESTTSGDTDSDSKTEQSYEVLSALSDDGYYDISVTTESESNDWPVNERSSESETSTVSWKSGTGYE